MEKLTTCTSTYLAFAKCLRPLSACLWLEDVCRVENLQVCSFLLNSSYLELCQESEHYLQCMIISHP